MVAATSPPIAGSNRKTYAAPPSVLPADQISGAEATSSTLRKPSPLLPTLLFGSFGLCPSWQSPLKSLCSNGRPLFATKSTGSGAVSSMNVIRPGSDPGVSSSASCAFCSSSSTHRPRYASAICPPRLAIVLYFLVPFLSSSMKVRTSPSACSTICSFPLNLAGDGSIFILRLPIIPIRHRRFSDPNRPAPQHASAVPPPGSKRPTTSDPLQSKEAAKQALRV